MLKDGDTKKSKEADNSGKDGKLRLTHMEMQEVNDQLHHDFTMDLALLFHNHDGYYQAKNKSALQTVYNELTPCYFTMSNIKYFTA